jgi:hypothetical protein
VVWREHQTASYPNRLARSDRSLPLLAFTDREGDEGRVVYSRCEHFHTRWNHKGPITHVCHGHPRCEIAIPLTVPIAAASIDDDVQLKTLTAGIGSVGEPDREPSVGTGSLLGATVLTGAFGSRLGRCRWGRVWHRGDFQPDGRRCRLNWRRSRLKNGRNRDNLGGRLVPLPTARLALLAATTVTRRSLVRATEASGIDGEIADPAGLAGRRLDGNKGHPVCGHGRTGERDLIPALEVAHDQWLSGRLDAQPNVLASDHGRRGSGILVEKLSTRQSERQRGEREDKDHEPTVSHDPPPGSETAERLSGGATVGG